MSNDRYTSLTALKEHAGILSYRIRCLNRNSAVTIISPHGGFIEPGTSAIARDIAGRAYNLFDFQGLQRKKPFELHVTSTRFRHPVLSDMLHRSNVAVSVHSMGDSGHAVLWLGGLNRQLKSLALVELQKRGFDVNPDSPKFRGESPKNIVNLARHHGVQLELSKELLDELFAGTAFHRNGRSPKKTPRYYELVTALRSAIKQHLEAERTEKRTA